MKNKTGYNIGLEELKSMLSMDNINFNEEACVKDIILNIIINSVEDKKKVEDIMKDNSYNFIILLSENNAVF